MYSKHYLPLELKNKILSYLKYNCKCCNKSLINPYYSYFCSKECVIYFYFKIQIIDLFHILFIIFILVLNFCNEFIIAWDSLCESIYINGNCLFLHYYFSIVSCLNVFMFFIFLPCYLLSVRDKYNIEFEY